MSDPNEPCHIAVMALLSCLYRTRKDTLRYVPGAAGALLTVHPATIKICENQGVAARNKHFQDSIHYFRDMNARNYVVPTFVRTGVQRPAH